MLQTRLTRATVLALPPSLAPAAFRFARAKDAAPAAPFLAAPPAMRTPDRRVLPPHPDCRVLPPQLVDWSQPIARAPAHCAARACRLPAAAARFSKCSRSRLMGRQMPQGTRAGCVGGRVARGCNFEKKARVHLCSFGSSACVVRRAAISDGSEMPERPRRFQRSRWQRHLGDLGWQRAAISDCATTHYLPTPPRPAGSRGTMTAAAGSLIHAAQPSFLPTHPPAPLRPLTTDLLVAPLVA